MILSSCGIHGKTKDRIDLPCREATVIKALARAYRWKRMLESGHFATIGDLASKEGIAPSYVTRVMRMMLLAPEIIEAIVEGRQGPEVTLAGLLEPVALEWVAQRKEFDNAEC